MKEKRKLFHEGARTLSQITDSESLEVLDSGFSMS